MVSQDAAPLNPFVGPRPLQQGEALHGRERDLQALCNRLLARRIVVLHSPSGAGKSSLVNAGLVPELKRRGFAVSRMIRVHLDPADSDPSRQESPDRPDGSVNRYLHSVMLSLRDDPAAAALPMAARSILLHGALPAPDAASTEPDADASGPPTVLVFDQFEELLTVAPHQQQQRHDFCVALGQALRTPQLWVLFVMREDHLAALAPYREHFPTHLANTYRLDLLGRDDARDVLVKAAASGQPMRSFPGADRLAQDLSRMQVQRPDGRIELEPGPFVEPVYLQVVARQLWDSLAVDKASIDDADIAILADVSKVLARYYDEAVVQAARGSEADERALREWVRTRLLAGGIRAPVRCEPQRTGGLDNTLIAGLVERYLVRVEQRSGFGWYELAHDRLVAPVQQANADWEQDKLHASQVQARLWDDGGRSPALLLSAGALPAALAAAQAHPERWTLLERDFLAESTRMRAAESRQRQRWRAAAVVLSLALVVAATAAVVAYRQSVEAREATLASYQEQGRRAAVNGETERALVYLAEVDRALADVPQRGWAARFMLSGLSGRLAVPLLQDAPHDLARMAFDAVANRVAGAAPTGGLRVWDAANGRLLHTIETRAVTALALSANGHVAYAEAQGGVVVMGTGGQVQSDAALASAEPAGACGSATAQALAFASGDNLLGVGCADGSLALGRRGDAGWIWSQRWPGRHAVGITAVAFSADGRMLASADATGWVKRTLVSGRPIQPECQPTRLPVHMLAFSADARTLAVAGDDWTVRRVRYGDGASARLLPDLVGHTGPVRAAAFATDGLTLATAGDDGGVRLWSVGATPGSRDTPAEPGDAAAGCTEPLRPAPDAGTPERPRLREPSDRLDGHSGAVLALTFLRDVQTGASTLASAGRDGSARRWLPERLLRQLAGHDGDVHGVAFSTDGRQLATVGADGRAWLHAVDGRGAPKAWAPAGSALHVVAFAPDGRSVAAAGEDGRLLLWQPGGSDPPRELAGHQDRVRALAFTPDSRSLVTAGQDGSTRVWSVAEGAQLQQMTAAGATSAPLRALAVAPDGRWLVSAGTDGSARLWQLAGGAPIAVLQGRGPFQSTGEPAAVAAAAATAATAASAPGHQDTILSVAVAPDGSSIATASRDGTARLWASDGRLRAVLSGHRGAISMVRFSPDGRRLATAGADGTVGLWRVADGALTARLVGHADPVIGLAFAPGDGRWLATASFDHTARLWDVTDGRLLGVLQGHWGMLWGLALSADGRLLATAGGDGRAMLWRIALDERPNAELTRQIRCRIPWALRDGALVPQRPAPAADCRD